MLTSSSGCCWAKACFKWGRNCWEVRQALVWGKMLGSYFGYWTSWADYRLDFPAVVDQCIKNVIKEVINAHLLGERHMFLSVQFQKNFAQSCLSWLVLALEI